MSGVHARVQIIREVRCEVGVVEVPHVPPRRRAQAAWRRGNLPVRLQGRPAGACRAQPAAQDTDSKPGGERRAPWQRAHTIPVLRLQGSSAPAAAGGE